MSKPLKAGTKWTPEEQQLLVSQLRNGLVLTDIAENHSRSLQAIEKRIQSMYNAFKKAGRSDIEIATEFGRPVSEVEKLTATAIVEKVTEKPAIVPGVQVSGKNNVKVKDEHLEYLKSIDASLRMLVEIMGKK